MKLLPAPLLSLSLLALWVMLQGSVDPGTVMLGALVTRKHRSRKRNDEACRHF